MAQSSRRDDDRGFMMVALLIGMAIAAIWMTAALPSWRQQVQRTREEDLIFRGEQYARAIMLYQDKNRNIPPPSIDILVSQHYLRKKWKDPVTNDDFQIVGIGIVSQPGASQQPFTSTPAGQGRATSGAPINTGGNQTPGITGVRSKSTAASIKVYQQQQQYNLWPFDAATYRQNTGQQQMQQQQQGGRQGAPGDRGGQQQGAGGVGGRAGGPGRGGDTGGARPAPPAGGAAGGATGGRGRGSF